MCELKVHLIWNQNKVYLTPNPRFFPLSLDLFMSLFMPSPGRQFHIMVKNMGFGLRLLRNSYTTTKVCKLVIYVNYLKIQYLHLHEETNNRIAMRIKPNNEYKKTV